MRRPSSVLRPGLLLLVCAAGGWSVAGCSSTTASATPGVVQVVGAENEYANVASQIGGPYVQVHAVMSNPNTDPHTFEASPSVAQVVSTARLVIQNGVGYDTFMNKIEAAAPDPTRKVIDVQDLLGLPDSTPNPHLWYSPATMPAVARAIAGDLSTLDPSHASTFGANLTKFDDSLTAWLGDIEALKVAYGGAGVATTEPVADYLLQAAGLDNRTPFVFQADIMNGVDPSPQDVTIEKNLLVDHEVKVFVYNQQVTDSFTSSLAALARSQGIPVVGVYETMPVPGYDYQSWMVAEVEALHKALSAGVSTTRL